MGENKANAISHLLCTKFKKETKDQHKKIMHNILWVVEMLKLREKNHIHTHVHSEWEKMQHQQKKKSAQCTFSQSPSSSQIQCVNFCFYLNSRIQFIILLFHFHCEFGVYCYYFADLDVLLF